MSSQQYTSNPHPSLQYTLHPLISQLNMDLLRQSPHNALQYIKYWATKKLKQMYDVNQDQSQEEQLQKQAQMNINTKIIKANSNNNTLFTLRQNNKSESIIKRRNAVVFAYGNNNKFNNNNDDDSDNNNNQDSQQNNSTQYQENELQMPKNQQTNSRLQISLKNDIFFKNLSWQQIDYFVTIGKVFETKHQHQLIQCAYENMNRFFIIVSGEVYIVNTAQNDEQQIKTFYTGESFCHQSFLYMATSQHSYYARQAGTLLFTLSGEEIKQTLEKFSRDRFMFYEKALMNKQEFNYLDIQQRDKVIRCFKQRKQIMAGEVVFRGQIQSSIENKQKRFYLVVKGLFSKCKKSSTGELIAFKQLRQGDYFGEQNLLMLANIDYTVICVEDNSEIAYLDKNALDAVVDDYGRIVQRAKMQVKYISG